MDKQKLLLIAAKSVLAGLEQRYGFLERDIQVLKSTIAKVEVADPNSYITKEVPAADGTEIHELCKYCQREPVKNEGDTCPECLVAEAEYREER